MGPQPETSEYNNQIETIKMRLDDVKDLIQEDQDYFNRVLMLFVAKRSVNNGC